MTGTVQPLLEEWLTKIKKPMITPHTYGYIAGMVKRYIYPQIGELAPSEVTPAILQSVIDKIEAKTMAHKSRQMLKEFFAYCVKLDIIKKSPATKIISPYRQKSKPNLNLKTLTEAEQEQLINAVSKSFFWHPFCLLILKSGIRLNEVLALSWKDIDFKAKSISIDKYVTGIGKKKNSRTAEQKPFYIQKYRTPFAVRIVPISDEVLDTLKKYRLSRELEQMRVRRHYALTGSKDLVFGTKQSELRNYSGVGHVFNKYLNYNGLADMDVGFAIMRYTYHAEQRKKAFPKISEGGNQIIESDAPKPKPMKKRGRGSEM